MSTTSKLKIIPLGGLEAIGMNITAFEYEDSIVVVDCGLAFPEDDMYGIDLVIPDVSYLLENEDKVKGFVFTHGHEDHIGALPYILKQLNVPIYATKLTMGLIELKLAEHELLKTTRRKVIHSGQTINLGQLRVEFIRTNHSIQDAVALAIYSSFKGRASSKRIVAVGEVGLTGHLRSVANADKIIQEAIRLGYEAVILPAKNVRKSDASGNIQILGADSISDAIRAYLK